jgi:hypothetical protein
LGKVDSAIHRGKTMVKGTDETADRQVEQQKLRRFQHLLIKVGLVYALLSVVLFFLFSNMMQQHAYHDMSRDEIQHISEMVFESMYTAMLNGGGMNGIEAAARRMNETGPGMVISVVRGETIAAKYGDHKADAIRRQNDLAIFDVFRTGDAQFTHKEKRIRYLYPAMFREQCKECHETSTPGEVAAVVEIIYPIKNLKVSTSYVDRLMLSYFAFSFVVLIAFLAWRYKTD